MRWHGTTDVTKYVECSTTVRFRCWPIWNVKYRIRILWKSKTKKTYLNDRNDLCLNQPKIVKKLYLNIMKKHKIKVSFLYLWNIFLTGKVSAQKNLNYLSHQRLSRDGIMVSNFPVFCCPFRNFFLLPALTFKYTFKTKYRLYPIGLPKPWCPERRNENGSSTNRVYITVKTLI